MLNQQDLINLIEKRYFNAMDQGRLDDTLACLAPSCVWNIYPAGMVLKGRDTEIKNAFVSAIERYPTMWHGNFKWIIDEAAQKVAATFDVRLVDKGGRETSLSNVKLFKIEDGLFTQLDLYFSTAEPIVS